LYFEILGAVPLRVNLDASETGWSHPAARKSGR
jgi:hypothetical protein